MGHYIWETIPSIEFLLSGLETQATGFGGNVDKGKKIPKRSQKQKDDDNDHRHLLVCIRNAQDKLEEYYGLMQESPVYAASVVDSVRESWARLTNYTKKTRMIELNEFNHA